MTTAGDVNIGQNLGVNGAFQGHKIIDYSEGRTTDPAYYKLNLPQHYWNSNNDNGGHVRIMVVWQAGHASSSHTKIIEFTYGTHHSRADDGYLEISEYAITHESDGVDSYGGYTIGTPTLSLYRGVVEDGNGYCGAILKVTGLNATYNKRIHIRAEVTGDSVTKPTLTGMGDTLETGAVLIAQNTKIGGILDISSTTATLAGGINVTGNSAVVGDLRITGDVTEAATTGAMFIYGGAGAKGTPTYSFYNDTDTGMYRTGENNLAFATNGGMKLDINSAGKATFAGEISVAGVSTFAGNVTATNIELNTTNPQIKWIAGEASTDDFRAYISGTGLLFQNTTDSFVNMSMNHDGTNNLYGNTTFAGKIYAEGGFFSRKDVNSVHSI